MCDYSLASVKARPAIVNESLTTHDFTTGTKGFRGTGDSVGGSCATAVCVLPGTEIAFESDIVTADGQNLGKLARFRQQNLDQVSAHHDALEFVGGKIMRLTDLTPGLRATVLQLPATPNTKQEADAQKRAAFV